MNMFLHPFQSPVVPTVPNRRDLPRTQGYDERPVKEAFSHMPYEKAAEPVLVEEKAEEPTPVPEKSPVDNFLEGQFKYIQETVAHHLARNNDKAKLDAALAEVEFYKQIIADAKVAWTKTVPHEEFNWDGLIDLGTILSRTPPKAE